MKNSSQPNDPEFVATERAYGGRAAYDYARTAGRTKLNYRQWVQVRTPTFKVWFGNWEKARHADILNGESVTDVQSHSVPQTSLADVREWALEIFKKQGGEAENPELGRVILNEKSVRDSLGHGKPSRFKYAAFAAVKDVLERGAVVHHTTRGRDGNSFYVSAPAKIDGTDDVVTVLVHRDPNTQRMYLHGVATKESLLRRRGSSADIENDVERAGSSGAGDIRRILQGRLNFNRHHDAVSKAIDRDTGEPLVLYRSTDSRSLLAPDTLEIRQKETPVVSPRDTPKQVGERAASANTGVNSIVHPPLRGGDPSGDPNTQRMDLHGAATKESLLRRRGSSVDATGAASERSGSSSAEDGHSILQGLLDSNTYPDAVSKTIDFGTGKASLQKALFFTQTPTPSSDMAHPVFLNAKALDGEMDHIHDGNTWQVFDQAQILSAVGNSYPLDRDDPEIVKVNLSAGDQPMANPIENESTVYGAPRQAGAARDTLPDLTQEHAFLANELLVDESPLQAIATPFTPTPEDNHEQINQGLEQLREKEAERASAARERSDDGRSAGQHEGSVDERSQAQRDREEPGLSQTARKRPKKAKSDAQPSPASKEEKPKRARSTKAKEKSTTKSKPAAPQPTPAAPAPAPAPSGVAALDPHAQQRLDRVASNRAADLADAKKKLDAEAMNRARIHLLQDPAGRHIVAIDQAGVTKAYAVDQDPGIAAKTVNKLREGMRKLGGLADEIGFLPDVIKTRFRLKSGEEKIAYNVDPEGVDPRHPHMREAGLNENDRRNLVVIPDGHPDEISKKVLLSTDLPDDVKKRFVYSDTVPGQYFDRGRKLAFIDKGARLATDQNAPEIIASMVSIAQAKGWKAITVKGHEDFRREAWLTASLAGIEVKGFKPSDPDLARLEYERQVRMGNAIQAAAPTPAPAANEIAATSPEKQSPTIGAEAIALGEVARLKGVREDQIPNFMKAAQTFIDQAKRDGIDLPALKIFDSKAPAAPAVTTPDKTREPREPRSIDTPHLDKAPKR